MLRFWDIYFFLQKYVRTDLCLPHLVLHGLGDGEGGSQRRVDHCVALWGLVIKDLAQGPVAVVLSLGLEPVILGSWTW